MTEYNNAKIHRDQGGSVETYDVGSTLTMNGLMDITGGTLTGLSLASIKATNGNIWYVDSVSGSDGYAGTTWATAFATVTAAQTAATANNGDVVFLAPGHAETITAAGGITLSKAGITYVGVGIGADRPTFTFTTSTAATMLITGAGVKVLNILGLVGSALNALVSPFVVQAADVVLGTQELPVTWRDYDTTHEAVRAVLGNASADRFHFYLIYEGQTGGSACVNAIRLVGSNTVRGYIDFYGKASTSVIEFITTLSSDVEIAGRFYNSGTTDFSKNVVNTGGLSCTYHVVGFDATAGQWFSKGDVLSTVQSIDQTTVTDALFGANGVVTYPAGAVPGNGVSIAEVLRDVWDAVRNGTGGTEPGTNKSIVDAIGFDGVAAVTATAGMLRTAAGTSFILKKAITSSDVTQAGTANATVTASVGDVYVEEIILETNGTGLAAGTNINFTINNVAGLAITSVEAVANLGANKTVNMTAASVTTMKKFVLESTKTIVMKSTVADCTGAGIVNVYFVCRRVADNSTLT